MPGSTSRRSWPTTTSYGDAPPTWSRVRPAAPASGTGAVLDGREHALDDLVQAGPVGVHDVGGDRLVDRCALVDELLDPAAHVAQQHRPGDPEADPGGGVGEAHAQEHDAVTGERVTDALVHHRSPAE